MQAHRITILIVDHDGVGEEDARMLIHNARYPNHCLSPHVISFETAEIGEWDDDNPLNSKGTQAAEVERLFTPTKNFAYCHACDSLRPYPTEPGEWEYLEDPGMRRALESPEHWKRVTVKANPEGMTITEHGKTVPRWWPTTAKWRPYETEPQEDPKASG